MAGEMTEGKRKRGGYRENAGKLASITDNTTARPDEISKAIQHGFQYFKRPLVKSDEECVDRINGYFSDCQVQGRLPTVEGMSLALGTVRQVVWQWEQGQGCSAARADIIKKAKQILATIDADLVASGKIPQVVYIFRSKNFYGMTDQQDIQVTTAGTSADTYSAEDIARRYLDDGRTVETTFSDSDS